MRPIVPVAAVTVEVAGTTLAPERQAALAEISVDQALAVPALCELVFADPAGWDEAPWIAVGDALIVTVRGDGRALFAGDVTAVHHAYEPLRGRVVRLRAYDALHRLRRRRPARAHVQVTAAALAATLVADLGLSVIADDAGPRWSRLLQHRQDDLELLIEAAGRSGLYPTLCGDELRLVSLAGRGEPLPLALGDTLLEADIEANAEAAARSASALAWDPRRGESHRGTAGAARCGRTAEDVSPEAIGADPELRLTDVLAQDEDEAAALAQAALDRRAAAAVVLRGVAEGDARLVPGAIIEVSGVAPAHAGRYVLTEVTHRLDAHRGYVCDLSTAPPRPRTPRQLPIAALGTVCRIDDPDRLGRVQVTLPAFGGLESEWIGVVAAGAGAGKGLMALPDVGDRVLVLLPGGDPARGVVLGGLYGAGGMADDGIDGGNVRRFTLLTTGGQRITLDDRRGALRLEDARGSFVDLDPQRVLVHAERAALTLEAPGHRVVVRGAAIDFEEA